ncbi:MAG: RNA-binding S4 domain-containing protein [Planctomycetes bacterium]|jgi:ribosome-associated protein|nr:RNA-binding S4 domain-containing protein [Planctomycetota bacterium]MBT6452273.1 RNA-binding S4 domain-containing protein [Planctomycetota bacterium]MBT6539984.1 RNA-binding S4 domain-containing protein [Planctomycetota bacterium]MBT6785151.1 RNA-binding S4 domain-containing protein [Planctomycetota bacterium]MBT6969287.1 RNA-binding S4 domain-containing protein [Planctomycetota bacterium]
MKDNSKATIRLSQFLKWKGLCGTGGEAKIVIFEGEVEVNGEVETRRGRVLREGDRITFEGEEHVVALGEQR